MKVSIILPVYNEEERLPRALNRLVEYLIGQEIEYEIIVAADGCTDKSVDIAEEYALENPNIIVVLNRDRLGKGGGFLNGCKVASGDVFFLYDVDMAVPPDEIPRILNMMNDERVDLIFGSRHLPKSIILVKAPVLRRFLSKTYNRFFRLLFGLDIRDSQCGFKAVRREVVEFLSPKLRKFGYAFDVELAVKASKYGFKIVEVPITWSYVEGSKIRILLQSFEIGKDTITLWFSELISARAPPRILGG